MKPTKKISIIDDVFDSNTIKDLYESVLIHFDKNLLSGGELKVTNSIIDCHGLALSNTSYFPYQEKCWNILCLKIKKHIVEYCEEYGYDSFSIIPFSCWAEKSGKKIKSLESKKQSDELLKLFLDIGQCNIVRDKPSIVTDHQVKKHFIRSVYNLVSPDDSLDTKIIFSDTHVTSVPAKPNRLIVYDGGSFKSNHHYPSGLYPEKINIVFDWYINEPFDVPDWILP